MTVALAGNPNSGKTTIFNNLTGLKQHVGNYPGVTVEKKTGTTYYGDVEMDVVDLPGIYSLTAYSIEEIIARRFVIEEKPDVVIDVLDASNLERNLYLATQFMELGVPLVLVLNMSDVAASRGFSIDMEHLSRLLGTPLVPTVGHKGKGMADILRTAVEVGRPEQEEQPKTVIRYGREIEEEIRKLTALLEKSPALTETYVARWLAVKLLESDDDVLEAIRASATDADEILAATDRSIKHLKDIFKDDPEIVIAGRRYGFISGACQEAVRSTVESRHNMSDHIDAVVTNRVAGMPIFLLMMYLTFKLTFVLGEAPMGWIEGLFERLAHLIGLCWPKGSESAVKSLIVDGVIGGVGGVIVFLPNILLLFLAIAILEDSGYMARAAFVMDELMHKIGLHGKSFIPMLIGFGCSVPAIMATRTLENRRDRMTTMLVIPLMSCGARLTIYALFIPAFFAPEWRATVLWVIYLIGIVLAVLGAKLLRATLFRGETTPLVMELPPYRVPTVKGALIHMWERGWLYLHKAGTIILVVSLVLWALTSYPKKTVYDRDYKAQAAAARQGYLDVMTQLNTDLGLPADSQLLRRAAQAELDMRAEQRPYHRHQRGFAEARKRCDAAIDELEKHPGGDRLAAFRRARDIVDAGDAQALSDLQAADPALYAAVARYQADVERPFAQAMQKIDQQKRAEELAYSVAGRIGHAMEPLLRPMGFDWRIGTALIGAFGAKEVFVAQMGIVFAVGEANGESEALRSQLRRNYTPLVAFCIMLFSLVSMPCMATIAVTKQESNSWGWALFQLTALTTVAYVLTVIVYQLGMLLGFG